MTARQLSLFRGGREARQRVLAAPEVRTHIAIADALRRGSAPGWIWNHFPAGEHRSEATGAKLQRMGLQPGWADLVLVGPDGTHHWLELKKGKATLSDEQVAFALGLMTRGVPYAVARSFEEAVAQLTAWGALRLRVSA